MPVISLPSENVPAAGEVQQLMNNYDIINKATASINPCPMMYRSVTSTEHSSMGMWGSGIEGDYIRKYDSYNLRPALQF